MLNPKPLRNTAKENSASLILHISRNIYPPHTRRKPHISIRTAGAPYHKHPSQHRLHYPDPCLTGTDPSPKCARYEAANAPTHRGITPISFCLAPVALRSVVNLILVGVWKPLTCTNANSEYPPHIFFSNTRFFFASAPRGACRGACVLCASHSD